MIALALEADWAEERGGFLRWVVPASIALHALLFTWMPSAAPVTPSAAPPRVVLEIAPPPPAPPPPAPPMLPSPAESARERASSRPTPSPSPGARVRAAAPAPTAPTAPTAESPLDFTSTVFSNDGPGLAVGGTGAALPSSTHVTSSEPAPPRAPFTARIVEPSRLARRPRAPGLDAELERQYPPEARRSGISGSAVLRVRILPDGRVGQVRVVSESWTGFGPACERTVRAARWEPPIDHDGAPVATEITYTCRFEVRS